MTEEPTGRIAVFGLHEILSITLRWRYLLIGCLVAGTLAAGIVALMLRPTYRASATLLIQSQEILTGTVAPPPASYADERIGKIRQQILNRENLLGLIRNNRLYLPEQRKLPIESVMAILRDAINVDLVGAPAGNGSQNNATIAFNIAYRNSDPGAAFHVTEQLTDMFVREDKRLRTEQVSGTASFFVRRANELRDRLVEMEAKRRSIQARYAGALPDQVAVSSQSVSALRAEISRMDAEGQGIMQQNGLIAARSQELAPPPPSLAQIELNRARVEYERLSAIYSDSHPDMVAAAGALARAQAAAAREPPPPSRDGAVQAEVQAGRARIAMLGQRRGALVAAVGRVEQLVSLSPQAAFELNNLERDYDNLKEQYQSIRDKQLDAQVVANLQAEGKGERFSIADPPSFPVAPISPKRMQIVMMGAIAGLGFGIALILAWELVMMPVHGPGMIAHRTGEAPLASIPVVRFGTLHAQPGRRERVILWLRRHVLARG